MNDQTPQVRAIATQLIRNAIKQIDSETACDHIVATLGEDVDVDALAFGSEAAVRKARIDISWDGAAAVPGPPADPSADTPREQLLHALDFVYCQTLGYGSPEELLAAYDADRAAPADTAALRETAAAVLAVVEAALGDTLTPDARVEALAGITALLPAITGHDTDTNVTPPPALTEEGRLRARVQVLEEDAERDQSLAATGARCLLRGHQGQIESGSAVIEGHRFALSVKLGLGTGAPWDAIHEQVAELRRVADETAATETQAAPVQHAPGKAIRCPDCRAKGYTVCLDQPAAGARQDGADRG